MSQPERTQSSRSKSERSKSERPLSPHLEIYRFSLTMALSILHRITGVGLYLGTALLAFWLIGAAMGPTQLDLVYLIMGNWFGQLIMLGFTWALFQHMLGGIKHFIWDVGAGLEPDQRKVLSWFTIIGGVILTALTWTFFVWI
ncbi:MAG: succinate dehydrogenase, cytochrome b556 subunit [Devosiaceae bacterium]|nr:succinate dehydrogenase, cytochrome b556 subunit [Devosiaceae bacterium]